MVRANSWKRWLRAIVLVATLIPGAGSAQEMVGDLMHDLALIDGALAPALSATRAGDPEASRLAMEELYRQWRSFRRMNFEGHSEDPRFVTDLEAVGDRLFAASLHVDERKLADAHTELEVVRILLLSFRERYGLVPPPR